MDEVSGKTILIVEDMEHIAARLTEIYTQIGLNVVDVAHNGLDGLTKVKNLKPELVSMDIIMPEMDGVECFRKIRDSKEFENFRPKVFFMSYLSVEPKVLESYAEEIPEYLFLAKNYSPDAIKARLERVINSPQVTLPTPPAQIPSSGESEQEKT